MSPPAPSRSGLRCAGCSNDARPFELLRAGILRPRARLRASRRPWLGGFNLLPYRQRNARLARRDRVLEWVAAVCAGCAASSRWPVAGDRKSAARWAACVDRTVAGATADAASGAREHCSAHKTSSATTPRAQRACPSRSSICCDLLDALSFEPGDGVVLQQLRQREHETELLATSRGHLASAEWLKRLSAIPGVKGAEMSDLHRPVSRGMRCARMKA